MSSIKRKPIDEPEQQPEKKQRLETATDYICHFRDTLLPNYDKSNPNHVARMLDLQSGDMRHFQNIVLTKLRLVVDVVKNPAKNAKKLYFPRLVNDLSNDANMSLLTPVGSIAWPKCGLTGDYKDGPYGGETLEKSKCKFSMSALSWSPNDRDANNQSELSLDFMRFAKEFANWINEQIWANPMMAKKSKEAAHTKATEEWEAKNAVLEECGKPPLPFTEDLVKKAWFKYHAANPVKLTKDKETKKFTPHTEYVDFNRPVLRNLTKKEKEIKKNRPVPYVGPSDLFTEAYYKSDKIEKTLKSHVKRCLFAHYSTKMWR